MAENNTVERLLEEISNLSVMQLAELTKAIEDKFGVSGAVAAAPAPQQAEGGEEQQEEEEKAEFNVQLESVGSQKMQVIKALRKVKKDLGLVEAKKMAEDAPVTISEAVPKDEAHEMKKSLEEAGATIKLT